MTDIPVEIHIHIHKGPDEEAMTLLRQLTTQGAATMASLDELTAAVAAQTTVVDSAVTLLGQLAQMVRDAGTDPAALAALADQIEAQSAELADAVTANTPETP
jgi:ABC-type transporter Mla subunit MlaD